MNIAPVIGQKGEKADAKVPAEKLTMNKEYCIWVVPPRNGRVRKLRFSWKHILCSAVVISAITSVFFLIAGDYIRVQTARAKNYINTKRMVSQLESFKSRNQELNSKLEVMGSSQQRLQQYEADIRRKVDELGTILEAATTIGLVDTVGHGAVPSEPGLKPKKDLRTKGVGGLELDCTGAGMESCLDSIADQDLTTDLDTLRIVRGDQDTTAELTSKLDSYIKLLKSIPLGYPVSGELNSGFGFRISPFSGKPKMHQGVDFSIPRGSYIYSTAFGTVKKVERNGTYGMMVDIEHGHGVVTRYAHLSRILVTEGQKISRGQIVGHVGSTGRSTGPHLHYEVIINGKARNPGKFMDLAYRLNSLL